MDWLDLVILALRIALVALLYAFLLMVIRAARRGLTQIQPAAYAPGIDPQRLKLVVIDAGASELTPGEVVEVDDGDTLGRTERADLVLADPTVSSEHARVSRVGRAWVVVDLGSTNGTAVNATRVTGSLPLAEGDVLALGGVRLRVSSHFRKSDVVSDT